MEEWNGILCKASGLTDFLSEGDPHGWLKLEWELTVLLLQIQVQGLNNKAPKDWGRMEECLIHKNGKP